MDQYFTPHVKRGAIYFGIIVAVLGVIGAIPLLNCLALPLLCVAGFAVPIGIGWLVAQWGGATDMAKGAIDGAIACGLGGLVGGVVSFLASLCFNAVFFAIGMSSNASDMVGAIVAGIIGGLSSWIFGAIFAAIFGAVGGLLYVAIQGNKSAMKPA
ncbi:MAG: hypothetical protein HZB51_29045 [Chloroflexi bacterium]|nr:hypothetical protein [Chloroflexota bacterium]